MWVNQLIDSWRWDLCLPSCSSSKPRQSKRDRAYLPTNYPRGWNTSADGSYPVILHGQTSSIIKAPKKWMLDINFHKARRNDNYSRAKETYVHLWVIRAVMSKQSACNFVLTAHLAEWFLYVCGSIEVTPRALAALKLNLVFDSQEQLCPTFQWTLFHYNTFYRRIRLKSIPK